MNRKQERILSHALTVSFSSQNNNVRSLSSTAIVQVWDDVLSNESCHDLHHTLIQSKKRQGQIHPQVGHRIFERSTVQMGNHECTSIHRGCSNSTRAVGNKIEIALDAILTQLELLHDAHESNDDSGKNNQDSKEYQPNQIPPRVQYVEYWTREDWKNIEAHADVDENFAKEMEKNGILQQAKDASYRYPAFGHVLYLQVGEQVNGPTCLFPYRKTGGDLLRPAQKGFVTYGIDSNRCYDEIDEIDDEINTDVELITVPAVTGRLLRFDGKTLHAVPRPTDLWLLPFVMGTPNTEPAEQWGRSVILFNTWYGSPPKDVPFTSRETEELNESANFHGMAMASALTDRRRWKHVFSYRGKMCKNRNQRIVDVSTKVEMKQDTNTPPFTSNYTTAKIWLLGTTIRRDYMLRTINLSVLNEETLRSALFRRNDVKLVTLHQPK